MAGFNITIAGDSAINLEFAKTISPQTSGMIRVAAQTLTDDPIPGVTELVPTFCSLMVTYDPCVIGYDELCQRVQGKLRNLAAAEAVLELRDSLPGLRLVAVVPFGGQEARFSHADRARYRAAMASADDAVVLSPVYRAGCYAVRNNYLVDHASLLVAWYDGSPGGTRHTVSRALRRGLEFVNLHPLRAGVALTEPTLF